jgi:RNA recognition motif-containing protein
MQQTTAQQMAAEWNHLVVSTTSSSEAHSLRTTSSGDGTGGSNNITQRYQQHHQDVAVTAIPMPAPLAHQNQQQQQQQQQQYSSVMFRDLHPTSANNLNGVPSNVLVTTAPGQASVPTHLQFASAGWASDLTAASMGSIGSLGFSPSTNVARTATPYAGQLVGTTPTPTQRTQESTNQSVTVIKDARVATAYHPLHLRGGAPNVSTEIAVSSEQPPGTIYGTAGTPVGAPGPHFNLTAGAAPSTDNSISLTLWSFGQPHDSCSTTNTNSTFDNARGQAGGLLTSPAAGAVSGLPLPLVLGSPVSNSALNMSIQSNPPLLGQRHEKGFPSNISESGAVPLPGFTIVPRTQQPPHHPSTAATTTTISTINAAVSNSTGNAFLPYQQQQLLLPAALRNHAQDDETSVAARRGTTSSTEAFNTTTLTSADEADDEHDDEHSRLASNVFVCMLPPSMQDSDLKKLFSPFGIIESAKVMLNIHTGQSRGIAFVKFFDPDDAKRAIDALDGHVVDGEHRISARIANAKAAFHPKLPTNKLFVRNVPSQITEAMLFDHFRPFGEVVEVSILSDTQQQQAPMQESPPHALVPHHDTQNLSNNNNNAESGGEQQQQRRRLGSGDSEAWSFDEQRRLVSDEIPASAVALLPRNIAFITFTLPESATKAAEATHATYPFKECGRVPLLAKTAEAPSSKRRGARLKDQQQNRATAATGIATSAPHVSPDYLHQQRVVVGVMPPPTTSAPNLVADNPSPSPGGLNYWQKQQQQPPLTNYVSSQRSSASSATTDTSPIPSYGPQSPAFMHQAAAPTMGQGNGYYQQQLSFHPRTFPLGNSHVMAAPASAYPSHTAYAASQQQQQASNHPFSGVWENHHTNHVQSHPPYQQQPMLMASVNRIPTVSSAPTPSASLLQPQHSRQQPHFSNTYPSTQGALFTAENHYHLQQQHPASQPLLVQGESHASSGMCPHPQQAFSPTPQQGGGGVPQNQPQPMWVVPQQQQFHLQQQFGGNAAVIPHSYHPTPNISTPPQERTSTEHLRASTSSYFAGAAPPTEHQHRFMMLNSDHSGAGHQAQSVHRISPALEGMVPHQHQPLQHSAAMYIVRDPQLPYHQPQQQQSQVQLQQHSQQAHYFASEHHSVYVSGSDGGSVGQFPSSSPQFQR